MRSEDFCLRSCEGVPTFRGSQWQRLEAAYLRRRYEAVLRHELPLLLVLDAVVEAEEPTAGEAFVGSRHVPPVQQHPVSAAFAALHSHGRLKSVSPHRAEQQQQQQQQ